MTLPSEKLSVLRASRRLRSLAAGLYALGTLAVTTPAMAQGPGGWGGWGNRGWGGMGWRGAYPDRPYRTRSTSQRDPRKGRVDVSRFVIDSPQAASLGKGPIIIESRSAETPVSGTGNLSAEPIPGQPPGPPAPPAYAPPQEAKSAWMAPATRTIYEAAVLDGFVGAGYDTLHPDAERAQVASIEIDRRLLTPAEEKRNPVSGSAAMSVGTYGSSYGLAVNVDLSKPRGALVATRMTLRIRDHVGGTVLWEGHAEIATRDDDDDWDDGEIAARLASALLDRFPEGEKVQPLATTGITPSD